MKEQLTVTDVINMLLRKWWIIALCSIIFSVCTFFYAQFMIEPLYLTDGSLYVNARRTQTSDVSQTNIMASQQLANTYKEILSRRTFLAQIAEDVDNKYTVNELKRMIAYQALNETEIMEVVVMGTVPEDVYRICHSILTRASDELIRVVNAGSVKILDDGQIPERPYAPNVKNYTIIAFLLGVLFGAMIILCIEFMDTRVKSRDDVINRYDEPLLGEIPELTLTAGNDPYNYRQSEDNKKGGSKK